LCCQVTQRLGKQLCRKIFCLFGTFKEHEQTLLVKFGRPEVGEMADRIEWNRKQNVQFVHNLVNTILLAATLRGSRPGVQSASLIMTLLMTS